MPRNKFTKGRRETAPFRLQDASGYQERQDVHITATIVQPVIDRIGRLELAVASLARGVIHEAQLELPAGQRQGYVFHEPPEGFVEEAIGQPVLICQRASSEPTIAAFTAEVVDRRRLLVTFACEAGVPKRLGIVYLIG